MHSTTQLQYPQAFIDPTGVSTPALYDDMVQAADVYHFIYGSGLFKGDRVFRGYEIETFMEAIRHPAVSVTTGNTGEFETADVWRKRLNNLVKNSESLHRRYTTGGSVGELLLAFILLGELPQFQTRRNAKHTTTTHAYLPLFMIADPRKSHDGRRLVSLYGAPVMCTSLDIASKATAHAREIASKLFPSIHTKRWTVTPITDPFLYD